VGHCTVGGWGSGALSRSTNIEWGVVPRSTTIRRRRPTTRLGGGRYPFRAGIVAGPAIRVRTASIARGAGRRFTAANQVVAPTRVRSRIAPWQKRSFRGGVCAGTRSRNDAWPPFGELGYRQKCLGGSRASHLTDLYRALAPTGNRHAALVRTDALTLYTHGAPEATRRRLRSEAGDDVCRARPVYNTPQRHVRPVVVVDVLFSSCSPGLWRGIGALRGTSPTSTDRSTQGLREKASIASITDRYLPATTRAAAPGARSCPQATSTAHRPAQATETIGLLVAMIAAVHNNSAYAACGHFSSHRLFGLRKLSGPSAGQISAAPGEVAAYTSPPYLGSGSPPSHASRSGRSPGAPAGRLALECSAMSDQSRGCPSTSRGGNRPRLPAP